ncbi:MAG: serine/threonine protein kinase [Deltaproteobacteria bacterium]|nr:serine/threonine protein kinase [Deltaproteobacteria bacterium]
MALERTYRFHEILGRGSFGTVYRATLHGEGGFSKNVAVKLLNEDISLFSGHARRLRDEARLLSKVRHRAILQVDGLVTLEGRWAVVTEYVPGMNLLEVVRRKPVPLGVGLEIIGEVAGALHVAFNGLGPEGRPMHLVHRDVKPSNIQLTQAGEVKLLDFGIAYAEVEDREAQTHFALVGSPAYMSPEQLDMQYGPEGDVYALGVVLCETISGERIGKTSANRNRHVEHTSEALARVEKAVGPDFEHVADLVRSMLAYDRDVRPAAREVEREARRLRQVREDPWLADWAEKSVPALGHQLLEPDAMVGKDLSEGALTVVAEPGIGELDTVAKEVPLPVSKKAWPWLRGILLAAVLSAAGFGWLAWQVRPRSVLEEATVATVLMEAGSPEEGGNGSADAAGAAEPEGGEADPPIAVPSAVEPSPPTVSEPRPAPKPASPKPAPRPTEPAPAPAAGTAAGTAGPPVTTSEFVAFLQQSPEWSRERAIEDGTADESYLRGWEENQPPSGASGWVANVSWWVAREFCRSRGGLASVEAAPLEWPEAEGPFQEWRADGGQAAWRRFDGATSAAVRRSDANAFTGFRCAR